MSRVTLWEIPGVKVQFEIFEDHPFIHLVVDSLTKEQFKRMKDNIEDFFYFLGSVGYPYVFAALTPDQIKLKKMGEMLGFEVAVEEDDVVVLVYRTPLAQFNYKLSAEALDNTLNME